LNDIADLLKSISIDVMRFGCTQPHSRTHTANKRMAVDIR
jgi:hypothetical protein